jgi:putative MATE family efflux protein
MKIMNKNGLNGRILKLALPAIAGLSTQIVVSLVDTAMVGRINNTEYALAAMGIGVLAMWALVSFFSSFSTGTHVMIARRFGNGDFESCGSILNTSLIFSFAVGIVVSFFGVAGAHAFAQFFAADSRVGNYAGEFLFYRFMGIPFFLLTVSYRGFFFGIGKVKVFMFSGILINLLNIVFNYILIFGALGNRPMGLAGSGLGSTFATICDALFYFCVTFYPTYRKKYKYFKKLNFNWEIVKSILKISLPVSFQNVFLLVGFLSFISITGLIGTIDQAASQLVISSLFLSIMPCMGFGVAVQTLVGNSLGSGNVNRAKISAVQTIKISTIYTLSLAAFFFFFPQVILSVVTTKENVISVAIPALRVAGIAQIFYAAGTVLANALQAAGKTVYVMITEIISNWIIFVPLSYFMGVYLKLGLIGAWGAMPFYMISYVVITYVKFKYGDWDNLKHY